MKTPFVWLGSGRTRKWGVGEKARLLDQAAKAGLPVPAGAVLLDEFFQLVVGEGVIAPARSDAVPARFAASDPQWLAETLFDGIRFPQLDQPVAIRAAFSSGGDHDANLTGCCPPQLSVDFTDPFQLARSLCDVWSAAKSSQWRRDVLVMEMAAAAVAGTAVSIYSDEQDQVSAEAAFFQLPRLRAWQRAASSLPPYAQRLQQLLRGVRRTFGQGSWEIDWADDGRICWLLQIAER